MSKESIPPPLTQRLVAISIQYAVPEQNELVFNIHFTNNTTGIVWDVTYKFSQLATLDHDISMHSDKMKEIRFPQIDDEKMIKLTAKPNYTGKLQELDRYRALMEDWLQSLVSRCHLMPLMLTDLVEDWFCLPFGPASDWRPGRVLSPEDKEVLAAQHSSVDSSRMHSISSNGSRPGLMRMASDYLNGDRNCGAQISPKGLVNSAQMPDPHVVLLKVRVQRGQKGRNGRVQYDIHIDHSAGKKPYIVSRSYSVFRRLFDIIHRVHSMSMDYTATSATRDRRNSLTGDGGPGSKPVNQKGIVSVVFPAPPFRSNLGLPLTEANLSYRTRQLDAWLREVCSCYRYMQEMEKAAVRYFLDLDLAKPLDIMIQDKLAKGLVEAPRANVYVPADMVIREKAPSEILETRSNQDHEGVLPHGRSYMAGARETMKSSASDIGVGKQQHLWETSSLASSALKSVTNAANIGRGSLFRGKLPNSALTQDRLDKLQSQLQQGRGPGTAQVKNQYNVTNSNSVAEKRLRMSTVLENAGDDMEDEDVGEDTLSQGSDALSDVEDREMNDHSLLRIGMDDKPATGKNRGTADQWVAREFTDSSGKCVIQ